LVGEITGMMLIDDHVIRMKKRLRFGRKSG